MIAHVSDAPARHAETLSTVQLAARVHRLRRKKVKVGSVSCLLLPPSESPVRAPARHGEGPAAHPWLGSPCAPDKAGGCAPNQLAPRASLEPLPRGPVAAVYLLGGGLCPS